MRDGSGDLGEVILEEGGGLVEEGQREPSEESRGGHHEFVSYRPVLGMREDEEAELGGVVDLQNGTSSVLPNVLLSPFTRARSCCSFSRSCLPAARKRYPIMTHEHGRLHNTFSFDVDNFQHDRYPQVAISLYLISNILKPSKDQLPAVSSSHPP